MATLYGQTANLIIPQSDFSAKQNENSGWDATQTFRIKKGDVDTNAVASKFQLGTPLLTLDPNVDDFFAYLLLSKIGSVQTVEGGWTDIACEFVGFSGSTSTANPPLAVPQPTYSKRGTLRSADLNEHPKWKALTSDEKWALGKFLSGDFVSASDFTSVGQHEEYDSRLTYYPAIDNSGANISFSADAQAFIQRIAQGKTTYEFGTYEYNHRWEDNIGVSAAQMNYLGKIVATPSGSPPTPGVGRDWLLVGVNEEQHGSGDFRFTNELQYLLSDEGGHDTFLYEA